MFPHFAAVCLTKNATQITWENENVILLWSERAMYAQIYSFSLVLFVYSPLISDL